MSPTQVDQVSSVRDVLASCQDLPAVLRALVHVVFRPHGAKRSFLAALGQDSAIELIDSYGYPDIKELEESVASVWNESASSLALLSGEITFYPSWEVYAAKFPQNADSSFQGHSFIAIPLWVGNSPTAVVGVALKNHPDPEVVQDLQATAVALRLVLELVLLPSWNIWQERDSQQRRSPRQEDIVWPSNKALENPSPAEFSERDLQVLRGMSEGLTNRQIASRLHLSLSSVGKISMRVFRKLGVRNRREASHMAKELSLVDFGANGGASNYSGDHETV